MHPDHRLRAARSLRAVALLVCIVALVPSTGRLADARRGRIVTLSGFALSVQPPGRGVFVAAIRLDGSVLTAGVQTRSDGKVLVYGQGSFADPARTVSPSACADSAFSLYPTSWVTPFNWYFNTGSTPSGISQTSATGALKAAANNITKATNDCGLPDLVSAKNAYKGSTTLNPNISSGSSCLNSDGKSVVGFGTLTSIYVGFSCWWTIGNDTVEADVKLNKANYTWYVTKPAGCSNKWDVQAVGTHEFGHVFGLLDLSEATHANLSMSTVINACQDSEDTLGLGDVLGLEAKY